MTQIPVDVYPRVPATVDFLKVGEFDKKLGGTVPWPYRLDGAFDDKATFLRKKVFALLRIGKSLFVLLDDVKIGW